MPGKKIISDRQLEVLVSFMEENRSFAVGRLANSGPISKNEAKQRWEELTTTLNAVGVGTTRTSAKWRDYWNEKKYAVRRKVTELREYGRKTGGGPAKKWSLTQAEERIFAVLGRESIIGNPSVQVPLHRTQPDTAVASTSASAPTSVPASTPASAPASTPASTPVSAPTSASASAPEPVSEHVPSIEMDFSLSESTSAANPIENDPTPPPQLAPTHRRSYRPQAANVPQWAMQIEERHLANEERVSRSLEAIAAKVAAIQRSVANIEESLVARN